MHLLVPSAVLATMASVAGIATLVTSPAGVSQDVPATPAQAPLAQCVETDSFGAIFAPGTDPAIVERVSRIIQQVGNERFFVGNRWPGSNNTPVTITYSFPSDGVNIFDAIFGGSSPNELHSTLVSEFGSEAAWKAQFAAIFQDWADITGNTYILVSDDDASMGSSGPLHGGSNRGDIRITSINIDGGSGILAYNFFPGSGNGGDMVIDSSENWGSPFSSFRFFRNTLSHEHGHGMGIGHVCPANGTKLMEPFLNTGFDGPQHDDIRAATFFYGDFYEPNNNSASAAHLQDFFGPGSQPFDGVIDMALRDNADDDYYSFSVDGAGTVDVSVTIVGQFYDDSSQANNGSCNSGNFIDSRDSVDPGLAILDVDGSTVLASVDANGFGGDESLIGVVLPTAGVYYIRVQSVSANDVAQLYNLSGTVTIDPAVGCVADLNGDGIVDTADLGILLGNFGSAGPAGDLNGDSIVDTADLGILLGVFGTCSTP